MNRSPPSNCSKMNSVSMRRMLLPNQYLRSGSPRILHVLPISNPPPCSPAKRLQRSVPLQSALNRSFFLQSALHLHVCRLSASPELPSRRDLQREPVGGFRFRRRLQFIDRIRSVRRIGGVSERFGHCAASPLQKAANSGDNPNETARTGGVTGAEHV